MRKSLFLLLALFIVGCNEHVILITPVQTLQPIEADLGGTYKSVQLKKVVCDLPAGKTLGHVNGRAGAPLYWDPTMESLLEKMIKENFYSAMDNAGYRTLGGPDALFDEFESERADIIIGAKVLDVKQNREMVAQLFDWKFTIEQFIEIDWQIYSRQTKKIIANYRTQGYQKDIKVLNGQIPVTEYIDSLVSNAIDNLLAKPEFIQILKEGYISHKNSSVNYVKKQLIFPKTANYTEQIGKNSSTIRSSAVTVKSNTGHGSGFIISTDGYALTNAHVVGSDAIVKIKLATGRECLADVISVEQDRDVAIIKIDQDGLVALPIQKNIINIGDEVYAMGSPLDESLSSTITKGVVSAFRKENGLEYIQSDVSIQQGNSGGPLMDKYGNVIGISVSGMFVGKAPMGLNFFIPIQDALSVLNIELK